MLLGHCLILSVIFFLCDLMYYDVYASERSPLTYSGIRCTQSLSHREEKIDTNVICFNMKLQGDD